MTQQETEDERIRRLIAEQLHQQPPAPPQGSQQVVLSDVLDAIDPRDSDSALELFGWLVDNGRLHRVATLTEGGYLFAYQEPKGSSKEGWVAGGTTGDRIVDDALDKAKESGVGRSEKGLCRHCYSAVMRVEGEPVVAENPREGVDPAVCDKAPDGKHEFAG